MDDSLLLWINGHHSPFWDHVMFSASQADAWLMLYIVLVMMLIICYRPEIKAYSSWKGWLPVLVVLLCIGAAVGLSDLITSGIIKKLVCRPRPSHSELAPLLHFINGYQGGAFGFPSSHAANCCCVALSFILLGQHRTAERDNKAFGRLMRTLYGVVILYALINCYSRMYLGVHYPSDILVGALIGLLLAWLFSFIAKKIINKLITQ